MANKKIRGITIQVGADTKPLSAALGDVEKKSRNIQGELKQVERLLKFNPGNVELAAQKQKLLADQVAATKDKLDTLKAAQEQVNRQFEAGKDYAVKFKPLGEAIDSTKEKLNDLKKQQDKVDKQFLEGKISAEQYEAFEKQISSTEAELRNLQKAKRDLDNEFKDGHIDADAYRAFQREIVETESKLRHFEQQLANTKKSLGDYAKSLQDVGSKMTDIGKNLSLKITAPIMGVTTAIGGMVAAFGWGRLTSMDAAKAQLEGLGYAVEDVARISEQVKAAVQGTVMTMAEGVSVAAGALAAGVAEGAELEKYIRQVGDAAVGANRPIADMAQIFNRIQGSGKLMTNELNMIEQGMPGFAAAMSEALGTTQAEFRKMVTDGKVSSEQFLDVMESFAGKMSEAYANSWAGMVSNTRAWIGIIGENLLSGVFEQSKESIKEFMELLKSDAVQQWAQQTGQAIGETFTVIVEKVKGLVEWFTNLSPAMQKSVVAIAGIGIAVGPTLLLIGGMASGLGTVATMLGRVSKLYTTLQAAVVASSGTFTAKTAIMFIYTRAVAAAAVAVSGLGAALRFLTGPIGLAISALALLVGWLIKGRKHAKELADGQDEVAKSTDELAKNEKELARAQAELERIMKSGANAADNLADAKDNLADSTDNLTEAEKKQREEALQNLNRLGDAIVTALRNRYDKEEQMLTQSLDKQTESVKTATDERIAEYDRELAARLRTLDDGTNAALAALRGEIDSINARTDKEQKAIDKREHQKRLAEKEAALREAADAKERAKIKVEIEELIAAYERKLLLDKRREKIDALRAEMDDIKAQADEKKKALEEEYAEKKKHEEQKTAIVLENLEKEKKAIAAHYTELRKEENLQAQARKMAIDGDNAQIIALLATYNPKWQNAGQSFGEALLDGLRSQKKSIKQEISELMGLINIANIKLPKSGSLKLNIPGLAMGGRVKSPGSVLVGERGPELLTLPQGAAVEPLPSNSGPQEVRHSGTITVRGVNDRGQLVAIIESTVGDLLRREVRA